MSENKLNEAISLVKAGNKKVAAQLLKEIVQHEPGNEVAWLWLYSCVDNIEQKKYCLQKAIEINPGNLKAKEALSRLSPQKTRSSVSVNQAPAAPVRNLSKQPQSHPRIANSTPIRAKKKLNKAWGTKVLMGLTGLIFSVGIVCTAGIWLYSQFINPDILRTSPGIFQIFIGNGTSFTDTDGGAIEPGIEENSDAGNGINPFRDDENAYDSKRGIFILNYGELIEVSKSQGLPSTDSPVLKFNDIVFILNNELKAGQVFLTEYSNGQFKESTLVETSQQGNGDAKRVELKNMKDGVYCLSDTPPVTEDKQTVYCFQVGNTISIASTLGFASAGQINFVPIGYLRKPDPDQPNWSDISIYYVIENYSEQPVSYRPDNVKLSTQQGFEYNCSESPIFSISLPPKFRNLRGVVCTVPDNSSGYTLSGGGQLYTMRHSERIGVSPISWSLDIEKKNTNTSFPVIENPSDYSNSNTLVYQSGQIVDLTDARIKFNLLDEGEDVSLRADVENLFAGGNITLNMEGTWYFSDGLTLICQISHSISLGEGESIEPCYFTKKVGFSQEQADLFGHSPTLNRFASSCLFVDKISIKYLQGNKEEMVFPNYLLICFP